jgi:signal transduction histidine kinase
MKHPSIRFRLMLGTGIIVAVLLFVANFFIYRAFERTLTEEIESQLLQSASLLAKSAELEANSLDYEWKDAMNSPGSADITGVFQFWDMRSGRTTKSPDLGDGELPLFYGKLNVPVLREITLSNGRKARAVGLLHHPFVDVIAIAEAAQTGRVLHPEDFPQVVVCARETQSLTHRLNELRSLLTRASIGTLLAIWASIFAISTWSLHPIRELSENLLEHSKKENPPQVEIPHALPSELTGLAGAFNTALNHVEKSRAREKEFTLHAAHELRTPVAGILITLEQALYRPRGSLDLSNRIEEALKITRSMRLTLNSLMRIARLRGGLEASSKTPVEPKTILREVLEAAIPLIEKNHLTIHEGFPEDVPAISTDPGLFRAVISNLIDNSIRHSPIHSTIEFHVDDSSERFVFMTINPCSGLSAENLDRLFEPFQRGSKAADNEGAHAGLGLSLAKEAALLMGGRIDVNLISDDRIRFTLTLPR